MAFIKYNFYNIPFWFKPFYYLHSYLGAAFIFSYKWLVLKTCKIVIEGQDHLDKHPSRIESAWHHNGSLYWLGLREVNNHVQFMHPAWYMNKIKLAMEWQGCHVIVGSTGHGGKEAADLIVAELIKGHRCFITPDGPYGPQKELKKGVLHMSVQSGVPILPVQVMAKRFFPIFWNWDNKKIPYFFTTITIKYLEPIFVTEENFNESHTQLTIAMGD